MAVRSAGRKLSFEILSDDSSHEEDDSGLYRSKSSPSRINVSTAEQSQPAHSVSPNKSNRKKRKHKSSRKKKLVEPSIPEDPIAEQQTVNSNSVSSDSRDLHSSSANGEVLLNNGAACGVNGFELGRRGYYTVGTVNCEEISAAEESKTSVCTVARVAETEFQSVRGGEGFNFGELRLRTVNGSNCEDLGPSSVDGNDKDDSGAKASSVEKQRNGPHGNVVSQLETAVSLDWNRLMAQDPNNMFSVDKSPVKCFMEEMYNGNSLRSTTTLGNEKERERVYDTIFRLPWRCELLINVGFFVCFDSFLSLLTIMPTRIMMTIWRLLKTRQFKSLSAIELSDFGCFVIMACGVILLERIDISLIYHMIRGQGTIKLYVVYNVLEIFDKLCQSFNGDVLQALFHSAEGLATSTSDSTRFWIWRYIADQSLAVAASIIHSFILLVQAITLSTCIVAHNNALLALLVSNNFAEIKSNVFKRYSRDNVHSLVYFDSVERFHISAFILFVLAQNILEAEGPWFKNFLLDVGLVYSCEIAIDVIKHSFIAKFNNIKPSAYSEFLEDLCKQTLNVQTEGAKKHLTFVPLAPACVVIRVLTPVYAAHFPYYPLPWSLFWVVLFSAVTYVMLASLKVLIGIGLRKHAAWYVSRCQRRKKHLHAD
ncbi:protein POLLEN DEFECTIVE IN GUIDANCE 1 [Prosopis cineraria]|uniref:protein POLLEN DEFECTIVE IN GUIDANCE 1 n=1 Tax=Prosopis cineraria TaxID=364024 RepID=UPI00240ED5E9|nr:protein POLLEN DEFECTIVE IN GUIDANCE 1 [Prosopis cineraria]